jgi:hypothetical protein
MEPAPEGVNLTITLPGRVETGTMSNLDFLLKFLSQCASGKLPLSECGAAWQMLVIAVLLVLAISTLAVLRLRSRGQASTA